MGKAARKNPAPKIKVKKNPTPAKGSPCVICGKISGEKKINQFGQVRHIYSEECEPCIFTRKPASKLVVGPKNRIVGIHSSIHGYEFADNFDFNDFYKVE